MKDHTTQTTSIQVDFKACKFIQEINGKKVPVIWCLGCLYYHSNPFFFALSPSIFASPSSNFKEVQGTADAYSLWSRMRHSSWLVVHYAIDC